MGEIDYNALLYDKMKAEQDKYRDWLLNQPPEEILNHTYEYTMREDIVMCMPSSCAILCGSLVQRSFASRFAFLTISKV